MDVCKTPFISTWFMKDHTLGKNGAINSNQNFQCKKGKFFYKDSLRLPIKSLVYVIKIVLFFANFKVPKMENKDPHLPSVDP